MNENKTKKAIAQSFRQIMAVKPFNKITIADIATKADISRMTFYYHFEDIYALLRYVLEIDVRESLRFFSEEKRWRAGLIIFLNNLKANNVVLANAIHSMGQAAVYNIFDQEIDDLILLYIMQHAKDRSPANEDLEFITHFYKYAFIGIIFDWVNNDMQQSPEELEKKFEILIQNNIDDNITNFIKAREIEENTEENL